MKKAIDVLEELESVSSRLAKEAILSSNVDNKLLKNVFVAALDPYVDYGVRKFKKTKPVATATYDDDESLNVFLSLLDKLASRQLTGNAAKDEVTAFFAKLDVRQQKWCERLLLKNLRCGVQDSTVNKAWPNLVKGFEVSLAKTLNTLHDKNTGIKIVDEVNYPIRVEPKLDGLRCVAVKANGVVTMYTRNGTVLDTLPTIKQALEAAKYDNVVLDGECMGADWNQSASVMMSRKEKKDDSGIVFNVFDAVMLNDWTSQSCDEPYSTRLERVNLIAEKTVVSAVVKQVDGVVVDDEKELLQFYASSMGNGYEGIMLKDMNAPYRFKRSDAILKMKPVVTYEGVIVGNYEGRVGTKRQGLFGGFEVVLPNGVVTRVGGGFNDEFRDSVQSEGPDSFTGRIVELEGQPDPLTSDGLTKDGRIRFPVFVRFRSEEDVDRAVVDAGRVYLSSKSLFP